MTQSIQYLTGFGNEHSSEAIKGCLPLGQNLPQKSPMGLYPEQISGSAFTAPNHKNLRSWVYRKLPSVCLGKPTPSSIDSLWKSGAFRLKHTDHAPARWNPILEPSKEHFIGSIVTQCGNGNVAKQEGSAIHQYYCSQSMGSECFVNHDGDMLIVPWEGSLNIQTEMGHLFIEPCEVVLIPRGITFKVDLPQKTARGYILENYGAPFEIPYRGPIGANGLVNPRDVEYPVAAFDQKDKPFTLLKKFLGSFSQTNTKFSPFNIVGWHGNYSPYKYDLRKFNAMGSITYDHPDPSIWTVFTSPSHREGVANVDFVAFVPRWYAMENTFRPPYYHKNIMSEYMGLIYGVYDAKPKGGFVPGGSSLHNCFQPHGPDTESFEKAASSELKPEKVDQGLAFMFESNNPYLLTEKANDQKWRQQDYIDCWLKIKNNFLGA